MSTTIWADIWADIWGDIWGTAYPTSRGYRGTGVLSYHWIRSNGDSDTVSNLLTNGDFESGDPPSSWTSTGSGHSFSQSTDQVKSGVYSAELTNGAGNNAYIYQGISSPSSYSESTMSLGCWVHCTTADRVYVSIQDYNGGDYEQTNSSYHGGTGWEFLIVSRELRSSLTFLRGYPLIIDGGTSITAYAAGAVCVEGVLISGGSTASYDDTAAPEDGSGRYYGCVLTAAGVSQQISPADRGYRGTSAVSSQGIMYLPF